MNRCFFRRSGPFRRPFAASSTAACTRPSSTGSLTARHRANWRRCWANSGFWACTCTAMAAAARTPSATGWPPLNWKRAIADSAVLSLSKARCQCSRLGEPDFGSNLADMRTNALRDGADCILNGSKMWITVGSVADVATVWARTQDGIAGFLMPRGIPPGSQRPTCAPSCPYGPPPPPSWRSVTHEFPSRTAGAGPRSQRAVGLLE